MTRVEGGLFSNEAAGATGFTVMGFRFLGFRVQGKHLNDYQQCGPIFLV